MTKKTLILIYSLIVFIVGIIIFFLFSPLEIKNKHIQSFILSQENILSLFFEEETVYSHGFNEEKWDKIEIGTSSDDVVLLIGEPLSKGTVKSGKPYWYYSKQGPKDTNYRVRIVVFDSNYNVSNTIREFYLD